MSFERLTQQTLMSMLHYDPNMGLFTHVSSRGGVVIGAVAGWKGGGYWNLNICYHTYRAHRLAWLYIHGEHPNGQVDHINCNKLDNRIDNLRVVTNKVNAQNVMRARTTNKSGFLGVRYNAKRRIWWSQIMVDGKYHYCGYFHTPEEAHAAYVKAKRRLHEGCTI